MYRLQIARDIDLVKSHKQSNQEKKVIRPIHYDMKSSDPWLSHEMHLWRRKSTSSKAKKKRLSSRGPPGCARKGSKSIIELTGGHHERQDHSPL